MPTVGYEGTCPKCGSDRYEGEWRYSEIREECPDCGYFVERSFLYLLARRLTGEEYEHDAQVPRAVRDELRAEGWHITRKWGPFRIGYIEKGDDAQGAFHFINNWFSIPAISVNRPTRITFIRLSRKELADFDPAQWVTDAWRF